MKKKNYAPTETPWLNILVLLFHNFVKEGKSQTSCFSITSHISLGTDFRKQNESSLLGNFQSHSVRNMNCGQGLWTLQWHNSKRALIIKKGA